MNTPIPGWAEGFESSMNGAASKDKIDVLKQWLGAVDRARGNLQSRTISICNQKGGVGKTVTAINLSAFLAAYGHRTLLVDLDPQGHSGLGLGLDTDGLDRSVYDVLVDGGCPVEEAIVSLRPNLDILPSNIDLSSAELELARFEKRERRLKNLVEGLGRRYAYVVIDCPPSLGVLTLNALVASQIVIIPVTPSFLSIHGLLKVTETIDVLIDSLGLELRVFFLITFFEKQLREAHLQRARLERLFGKDLLKTVVRKNTRLNEATRMGRSIYEYDRHAPGCRDYFNLAKEIMAIG
ncbi:MAG: ParA family protein [Deltaproteobacteria bacterium]|nr:ParA family protein [Deltaproteobacteria bacterium]